MDLNARRRAHQRMDRIAAFREELADLEREGALTLTPEQRTRLEAHLEGSLANLTAQFDIDVTESGKRARRPEARVTFLTSSQQMREPNRS